MSDAPVEHVLSNSLQRIEFKLDALRDEVHGVIKPDIAELKRKASIWGAVGGVLSIIVSQMVSCLP